MPLDDRAELLLKKLIQRYIHEGQPVGSRVLAREAGLDISPATIRNVMADLEDIGYISSPHTSAGRVPTQAGYRFFVDSLLTINPLDEVAQEEIGHRFAGESDPKALIERASILLSEVTHFAGLVFVPRPRQAHFCQIDFLHLSAERVLTILVSEDGQVQNRVIHVDRAFSREELEQAARLFNEAYSGRSLEDVRHDLLMEMQTDSENLNAIMKTAVTMAQELFIHGTESSDELHVSGETNLLEVPELCDLKMIRELLDTFKRKQELLGLLDKCMKANGIQIFIGNESGYSAFDNCSVITSAYEVDGDRIGTLGVIGPTRMDYEDVIPVVNITARLLGSALSSSSGKGVG